MALTKAKLQEQFDNSEYDLGVTAADVGAAASSHVHYTADGVMEISRYLDFHHSNSDGQDYAARVSTDGTTNDKLLIGSSTILTSGNYGTWVQKAITSGTGAPSGGSSGDIYIKYS